MEEKKLQKPFPTSHVIYSSGGTESLSETPKSPYPDFRGSKLPPLTKKDSGKGVNIIYNYNIEKRYYFMGDYIKADSEIGTAVAEKKVEKKDNIIKIIWNWLINLILILKKRF